MRSIERFLLGLALGAALTANVSHAIAAEGAAPPRPNLLVILVDDLGWGDLSSYGAKDLRTPHIDALVKAGQRWDNFYANCCVCSPTRAALLTGCYPERVGVPGVIRTHADNNWGYLAPQARLLSTTLGKAGYHTAIVGKWHLGLKSPNTPNERGFDHFHGFLGDMMDDYSNHRRHGNNYMRLDEQTIDPQGHATDLFSTWAQDYLRQRAQGDKPFFLYLAYNAPHVPIQPPQAWLARVRSREADISPTRARLVALIEHLDDGVGRVMATLKETGQDRNTLVVFTSDNGGELRPGANNGPWRAGKGTMYEGGLRVPMCVVWPGHVPPGTRSDEVGLTMDLYPSLCAAAGVTIDPAVDGQSLLPIWLGNKQSLPPRDVFFIRREGGTAFGGKTIDAIRRGDWKLLQNSPFAPQELYNLADDPREEHDLAKKDRQKFNELATALRRQIQHGGQVPWQAPPE